MTDSNPETPSTNTTKASITSKRILACLTCSQRKVRCDRQLPCGNCVRRQIKCIPTPAIPPRRHRLYREQDLLDRVRKYEDLLRKNDIDFEPSHSRISPAAPGDKDTSMDENDDLISYDIKEEAPDVYEQNVVEALNEVSSDSDDLLLFQLGTHRELDISHFHPSSTDILKFWQIYIERVDPIFKVTHTTTLQATVISTAGDPTRLDTSTEGLMYAIYCSALLSLTQEECQIAFAMSRVDLLRRYQIGCREAISRCDFLRTESRDCLTAVFLYLVSIKPAVDRRSLSTLLGTVVRIAQGMGIHSESANRKHPPFEAEMRRRLWWAIVLFDNRVCEGTQNHSFTVLTPSWDCKPPLDFNDFEIWPGMNSAPAVYDRPGEALYVVVRSQLGEFLRHSEFHLDLVNPMLKPLAWSAVEIMSKKTNELDIVEERVKKTCTKDCTLDNPLHFLTIWTLRSQLAKSRLLHHYWKTAHLPPSQQPEANHDRATSHALAIIECEHQLITTPLTVGFRWHISHFPFPAYVHIIKDLTKRPRQSAASRAWEMMSTDFRARFGDGEVDEHPVFMLFARVVLQAWEARGSGHGPENGQVPWIVGEMRRMIEPVSAQQHGDGMEMPGTFAEDMEFDFNFDFDQFLPSYEPLTTDPLSHFGPGELDWTTLVHTTL